MSSISIRDRVIAELVEKRGAAFAERVEQRTNRVEFRVEPSGNGEDYTLRGHAAVFGKLSEDLGGFREIIEPGFFRSALRKTPDVRELINHEPWPVLARTASQTLELREDAIGLHAWARVAPTQIATDLRTSMQRGDVDQMSFAFTLRDEGDDWAIAEDGTIVRTLRSDGCDELFDVSVVTFPAYPQTDAGMRAVYSRAMQAGRVPQARTEDQPAAQGSPADGDASAQTESAGGDQTARIALLKTQMRRREAEISTRRRP